MLTDGPIKTCKEWTGDEPLGCPWAAFRDPFVSRVVRAFPAWDKGHAIEGASHRLTEGLRHYAHADAMAQRMRWELEKKEREARA